MPHTRLINYALYQVGWFACVLGGAWQHPWVGLLVAATLVGVHLRLSQERALEVRLVVLATVVGVVVEVVQLGAGTYRFASGTITDALPPLWLLAMWAQFATTFRFSLHGVIAQPVSAVVLGAIGGPIAFLAGDRLGAVTLLPPLAYGLVRLSVAWAIALGIFSLAVRRLASTSGVPCYRAAH